MTPNRLFLQTGATNKIAVLQLGARMHYAVPRVLQAAGVLEHFFTDFCSATGLSGLLRFLPSPFQTQAIKRFLGRSPEGVPVSRITSFDSLGLRYAWLLRQAKSPADTTAAFLTLGREFCQRVNRSPWGSTETIFAFNSAALETLQLARRRGVKAVVEQTIAPRAFARKLEDETHERYPGWENRIPNELDGDYAERERAEWESADLVICGSNFVLNAIECLGGPGHKCVVVPYGVDRPKPTKQPPDSKTQSTQLRVLTVGSVGLRKGAPYVLDAARELGDRARFRWVGGIELLPQAVAHLSQHVQLTGPVARSQISEHFEWADVFLLPSLCEGSATATYEALSHGLPVICTPNTGSIVSDEIDGFLVPIRDSAAIVNRIQRLYSDRESLRLMSRRAKERSAEFTIAAYGARLLAYLGQSEVTSR